MESSALTRLEEGSFERARRGALGDVRKNLVLRGHGLWESSRCRPGVPPGRGPGRTRTPRPGTGTARPGAGRRRPGAGRGVRVTRTPTGTGRLVPSGRGTRRPGHPDDTRTPPGTPGRSGREGGCDLLATRMVTKLCRIPSHLSSAMLRRRTIPHVRQSHNWDCGLACLEMTLRALGVPPSLCTLKQLQQKAVGAGGPSRTREAEVPPEFQSFWCAPAPTSYARAPARGRLHRSTGRAGR
jgi:hypothetical protein